MSTSPEQTARFLFGRCKNCGQERPLLVIESIRDADERLVVDTKDWCGDCRTAYAVGRGWV
jgi:hypothetical protein